MFGLTVLIMFMLLILLPALIVRGCNRGVIPRDVEIDPFVIAVWNHRTEELMHMPLGEYLLGVVAAEMPADFHIEALKAQAIVARTYTINKLSVSGGTGCGRHPDADICTDSTHCQAWMSKDEAYARWPFFRQNSNWNKILRAVSETRGQVVTHEGKLIDALYHSTCGGSTENSEDVWANHFPYLRAVECRFCAHSPRFTETVRLTEEEIASRLKIPTASLHLNVISRTESGRIKQIEVGNQVQLRGLDFRSLLGLRSSRATWLREQGVYTFTTTGFGHAVGLCQYGADGMAEQGFTAAEILEFYYTDTRVQRVKLEE
jgi:stage II sporulation protein D